MTYTFDELQALIIRRGVHTEFGEPGEGWGIEQSPYELATFLMRMQELDVQSCLEIGTGYRGGLSRFLAADMNWRVTTVDIVDYDHRFEGVEYIFITYERYKPNMDYDLVFIDGDHGYNSVKSDYEKYVNYATKAIAFHDIMGLRGCEGAYRFWHDLSQSSEGASMVTAPDNQRAGIGWIEL